MNPPAGSAALAASVSDEVDACALAAMGQWRDARVRANDAALKLGTGGDTLRGYRSFWLYLAAVWADHAGATSTDHTLHRNALAFVAQAEAAAKPSTWIRELAPLPNTVRQELPAASATAAATVAARLRTTTVPKVASLTAEVLAGLKERAPTIYEPALTKLGAMLGAEALKPPGSGRCDSTWCWGNHLWLALDAKSDHEPTGLVPHKDVRQAGDQLRLLAADRDVPSIPPDSAIVIISPKPAVDPTAAAGAEPHVHIVHPREVSTLAEAAGRAWTKLVSRRSGLTDAQLRDLVADRFSQEGLLPEQVRERLTVEPVASQ